MGAVLGGGAYTPILDLVHHKLEAQDGADAESRSSIQWQEDVVGHDGARRPNAMAYRYWMQMHLCEPGYGTGLGPEHHTG